MQRHWPASVASREAIIVRGAISDGIPKQTPPTRNAIMDLRDVMRELLVGS